jgi:hypothetical protein
MKQQFNGTTERASTPRNLTSEYVYSQVKGIEVTFGKEKPSKEKEQ